MEDYGTDQIITSDKDDIDLLWKKGFCITAACACWLELYFAVTETVEEYEGKAQTWQFSSSWSSLKEQIRKGWENDQVIAGLCFSAKTEKLVRDKHTSGTREKKTSWKKAAKNKKYLKEKSSKGNRLTKETTQQLHSTTSRGIVS